MKIIVTENKRVKLAKQVLNDEFSNLSEDVEYISDGIGVHLKIEYINGDDIIMIYGDRNNALYISEDVTRPLKIFSYTPQEVKQIIGEWFSQRFELPVKIVHHVNKTVLN
jgi:hypothetical protein